MTATAAFAGSHPYLSGPYAPVTEEVTATALPVVGELPRDLGGVFVRNSSNPRFAPRGRYHWFDGDGMLQAVGLEDGVASYRNRYIKTKAFQAETEAGCSLWSGVTERPDFTNPRGPFKDSANTDVVFHAGKLLALWWLGGEPYAIRLPDLETLGTERFGGKVRTVSAHPKVDMRTGEMMFFDYKPMPPYLTYGVVASDGTLRHFTEIDLPGPRLQHDMAITERYSLVFDMSLMWDPELLKQGKTRVRFFRDRPSRIGVLPRHGRGDEVRWFSCEPFYMYHTINAWEEGDEVVLIGCRIEHPLADDPANPAPPDGRPVPTIGFLRLAPRLWMWRLNLVTGAVKEQALDDRPIEFPRMDNRALGYKSRYAYAPHVAAHETILFDGVIKYDHDTGASSRYMFPAGTFCGETTFAPRQGATSEDDGYVLTYTIEAATGRSELAIFDAKDLSSQPAGSPEGRGPIARVQLPVRAPFGYHTWWVPASDVRSQRAGAA